MACMLLLAACDNYLDIQPTGSVIPNSLAEYRALLARSYKDMSKFSDRGMACFRSDEMQVRDNEYDQNYYMDIERWNDLAPNAYTSSFEWAKYYSVLFIANHVIESKSDIKEGTEEEINQLVGEAYMLRAYVHFLLVNLYGQPYTKEGALDTKSVPLKLDTDLEKVLKRNAVKEVYISIQADIDEARKLLTEAEWEQRYSYRFNATSVEAFQSRVSLYKGEWQAAWNAAEAVLAVKSVLIDMNDVASGLPNSYNSVENMTPLETPLSSTINGAALATPAFLALYAENDLRLDRYFAEADENGFRKTLYWSKKKMEAHALKYSQGYAADKRKGTNWTFWSKDFDGMAYKTMLRQLISKWGIMSIEMQSAIDADMAVINDDGTKDYVDNQPEAQVIEAEATVIESEPVQEAQKAITETNEVQQALFGK